MSKTVKELGDEMKRMRLENALDGLMLKLVDKLHTKNMAYAESVLCTAQETVAANIVGIEYDKAKRKHPEFPNNPAEALCIIMEELGELAQAINDKEPSERQIEEAAHVAVTAIRFIEQRL